MVSPKASCGAMNCIFDNSAENFYKFEKAHIFFKKETFSNMFRWKELT